MRKREINEPTARRERTVGREQWEEERMGGREEMKR
jgi:hypothetical protein